MFTTATQAREPDGMVMQPSGPLVLFMGRTELPHLCCNLLLQTLECYRTCDHARLACFLFETNQHFVGSARIAGLFFSLLHLQHCGNIGRLIGNHHSENQPRSQGLLCQGKLQCGILTADYRSLSAIN